MGAPLNLEEELTMGESFKFSTGPGLCGPGSPGHQTSGRLDFFHPNMRLPRTLDPDGETRGQLIGKYWGNNVQL